MLSMIRYLVSSIALKLMDDIESVKTKASNSIESICESNSLLTTERRNLIRSSDLTNILAVMSLDNMDS